jgi:NAD(P)-dependent dehydrogenase (short-subunit alcohol dehydrogenase family)
MDALCDSARYKNATASVTYRDENMTSVRPLCPNKLVARKRLPTPLRANPKRFPVQDLLGRLSQNDVAMKRVEGKVVLVTGGALGIGRAVCERLAEEGAKVAVTDILEVEGREIAERVNGAFWTLDVANEGEVQRVVGEVAAKWGRLDAVVNNAGVAGVNKPTHDVTEEEWDWVQAVNVKGVFFCTKHAVPHLKAAGGGSVVNLSSIYGIVSAPDVPPYHASKGAVRLMTKTDALLYAKDKIRVNSVHPGFIWTPMVENHLRNSGVDPDEGRKGLDELHPLGRVGEPDDIAWAVVYLVSDEAKFVTGAEFVVDGGYTCR